MNKSRMILALFLCLAALMCLLPWEAVLQKSFRTNTAMDACCGRYDDFYTLYVESGFIPQ